MTKTAEGQWRTDVTPVHNFPLMDSEGKLLGWERRVYDDAVAIPAPAAR